MNNELNQAIENFYKFVIDNNNKYNETLINIYIKKISKVLEEYMKILGVNYTFKGGNNEIILKFEKLHDLGGKYNVDRVLNQQGVYENINRIITISSTNIDEIFSSYENQRKQRALATLKTLFHEINHFIENELYSSMNVSNKMYMSLKEQILLQNPSEKNFYKDNHELFKIELSSDIFAYDILNNSNIFNGEYDVEIQKLIINDLFSRYKINNNGKKSFADREKLTDEKISALVKEDPDLIEKYPMLSYVYNASGSKKNLQQLISEFNNLTIINEDVVDFYLNRIYFEMTNIEDEKELVNIDDGIIYILMNYFRKEKLLKSKNINKYFDLMKEKSLHINVDYDNDRFISYSKDSPLIKNGGYIRKYENNKESYVSVNEYIHSLNIKDDYIRNFLKRREVQILLPKDGMMHLKDNSTVTLEDYANNYMKNDIDNYIKNNNLKFLFGKSVVNFFRSILINQDDYFHDCMIDEVNEEYNEKLRRLNNIKKLISSNEERKI